MERDAFLSYFPPVFPVPLLDIEGPTTAKLGSYDKSAEIYLALQLTRGSGSAKHCCGDVAVADR